MKRSIVWLRNDLRVFDNPVLARAFEYSENVLGVYVFTRTACSPSHTFGLSRMHHRVPFVMEALRSLNQSFPVKVFVDEHPHEVLRTVRQEYPDSRVFVTYDGNYDEVQDVARVKRELGSDVVDVVPRASFVPDDFLLDAPMQSFSAFRRAVEKAGLPRAVCTSVSLPPRGTQEEGVIPSDQEVLDKVQGRVLFPGVKPMWVQGDEETAQQRLRLFIWESGAVSEYRKTRNGMLGDYSSRFSPFLSIGSLSANHVRRELERLHEQQGMDEGSHWLGVELIIRDYFVRLSAQSGTAMFHEWGLSRKKPEKATEWTRERDLLDTWVEGRTGVPIVDACMRELLSTGWMGNRARQIAASFLVNDLRGDWRLGAEVFEQCLVDHDCGLNYGNWLYIAGVGTDPRSGSRYFNPIKQSIVYDEHGEYIAHWCPELAKLNAAMRIEPHKLPKRKHDALGYPYPVVKVKYEQKKNPRKTKFQKKWASHQ